MFIAHLSDPHITVGPLGTEPARRLHHALGRVLALDPRPDCVVISGDLADHGRREEYEALQAVIGRFPLPIHLAAGNHDRAETLVEVFSGTPALHGGASASYTVDYPEATIVVLDSAVPWSAAGRLGPEQLAWLDDQLGARDDRPAVVCVHHPPSPVGIPSFDGMRLVDGPALATVIRAHPQVVRILSGHVHRSISVSFAGTTVSVAPSTYRQCELGLREGRMLAYLEEPTAFLLHWIHDGHSVTHTVQVSHAGGRIGGF